MLSAIARGGDGPGFLWLDESAFHPSRILVRVRPETFADRAPAQIAGLDFGDPVAGMPGLRRVRISQPADVETALRAYRADPAVVSAFPDYRIQATSLPNDPRFFRQWALDNRDPSVGTNDADIDAVEAWNTTTGSDSVVIAVIDTGVDYRHRDLAGNIWTNPGEIAGNGLDDDGNGYVDDVHGYDFLNGDGDPMDDDGHGTHVAGTIAAVGNNGRGVAGINWNASIMALKFLGADGSGYASDAIEAIRYATENGAHVINASWGSRTHDPAMKSAIDAFPGPFVAAAGNYGWNVNEKGYAGSFYQFYPAEYRSANIIAVAATDSKDRLASWSNFGVASVDLAAPGVDIFNTNVGGGYAMKSGTSMAAPHVAGVAGLLYSLDPTMPAAEVRDLILSTVDPLDDLAGKTVTGGRLNAARAVSAQSNHAPSAADDASAATDESSPILIDVLGNDRDEDGDLLGLQAVDPASRLGAAVTVYSQGSIAYDPTASATLQGLRNGETLVDTFRYTVTDGRGGVDSAAVSVTVRGLDDLQAVVEFSDSFELSEWNGLWVEDSQNDWFRSNQRAADGSRSAEIDGAARGATLTMARPLDLGGAVAATLTYSWFVEGNWDSEDSIALDIYAGAKWRLDVRTLRGDTAAENVWIEESVDLTSYLAGDFRLRFRAAVNDAREDGNVDNVKIVSMSRNGVGQTSLPPPADRQDSGRRAVPFDEDRLAAVWQALAAGEAPAKKTAPDRTREKPSTALEALDLVYRLL
ncbi:MAG: S8 family serine peptidase [Pirellulales bacterium]|nr:S8 family serine peptidase [Pirellulales bacterium]